MNCLKQLAQECLWWDQAESNHIFFFDETLYFKQFLEDMKG